jgi:hypothetical protein
MTPEANGNQGSPVGQIAQTLQGFSRGTTKDILPHFAII